MVRLSLLVASSLTSLAVAQIQSQISDVPVLQPTASDCGGCFVLADLVNVVFGGVLTSTVTQVLSFNGLNSSVLVNVPTVATVSTTATNDGGIQFSFQPPGSLFPGPTPPPEYAPVNGDNTVEISGAILTSPTQYNLVIGYTISSFTADAAGSCVGVSNVMSLSPASSYIVDDSIADPLLDAEQQFIGDIAVTCQAAGGAVSPTVQSMIEITTTTSTTSSTLTPTPISTSSVPLVTATSTTSIVLNTSLALPTGAMPTYTPQLPVVGAAAIAAPGIIGGTAALAIGLAAALIL